MGVIDTQHKEQPIEVARPLVSIGIPTFNRKASIGRTIESVLQQSYNHLEIVISDNASTDGTQDVCLEFCRRDSRIKYLRQSVNNGPSKNFAEVLRHSSGKYFMWLGDDDWLDENYIDDCVQQLEKNSEIMLVCGAAKYYADCYDPYNGAVINILYDNPVKRVLSFYRNVSDNGTFYGVFNRKRLTGIKVRNSIGGDWFMMAEVAFLGKIMTLDYIRIHRMISAKTGTELFDRVTTWCGLPTWYARFPHMIIAVLAFKDIMSSTTTFNSLRVVSRLILGLIVTSLIIYRFCIKPFLLKMINFFHPSST